MPVGLPYLKCIKNNFGEIFYFFNLNFLFFLYPKFFLVHFKYGGPAGIVSATTLCRRACRTWNVPREFWFWVVINWCHLQRSSFFQISRFGVTEYFSCRLWMVAKIFFIWAWKSLVGWLGTMSISFLGSVSKCHQHWRIGEGPSSVENL
jgi:hypothetical protein